MIPGLYIFRVSITISKQALHYKKYSTASDVWSYGTVMYEIWSVGHKPFKNYINNKVSLCLAHFMAE